MSDTKKYYWLKLKRDFFKRHDITVIESMQNGDKYLLFYMKLLVEGIDHEGALRFSDTVPYNDAMLAAITRTDIDIVRSAVKIFQEFGMMDIYDDGTLYMKQVETMIGDETEWAKKKREYKERKAITEITKEKLPSKYPYMLGNIKVCSQDQIITPKGENHFIDEKRFGGNGKIALSRANCQCEICKGDNVVIHHCNDYSNELDDLIVLCTKCHGQVHSQGGKSPRSVLLKSDKSKSKSKSIEIREEEPGKPVHPQAVALSSLLFTLHKEQDPKYNVSASQLANWSADIEKIARLDGRDYDEIEKVLRWAKADGFWRPNIMSGKKFREKFPTLYAQMTSGRQSSKPLPVHTRTTYLDMED